MTQEQVVSDTAAGRRLGNAQPAAIQDRIICAEGKQRLTSLRRPPQNAYGPHTPRKYHEKMDIRTRPVHRQNNSVDGPSKNLTIPFYYKI